MREYLAIFLAIFGDLWRSLAISRAVTRRYAPVHISPGAKETAIRDYYTTLRDFSRSYAISRDLSLRYALRAP